MVAVMEEKKMAVINGGTVYRQDLVQVYNEFTPRNVRTAARGIFPLIPVDNQAGELTVVTRESMMSPSDPRRTSAESGYNRINLKTGRLLYACEDRGLEHGVPRAKQTPAAYNAYVNGTNALKNRMVINTENIVAGLCCDTGVFTAGKGNFLDVATVWSDVAAPIIKDVETGCNAVEAVTGVRPNTLTVNSTVYSYLLANTGLLARFPGAARVSREDLANNLAAVLGLDQILVSSVKYNSAAATPDAFTAATVWSSSYAFLSVCAMPGDPMETPSIGRTPIWTPDGVDTVVEVYYSDPNRCDYIRARENVTELLIDEYFGYLMKVD
jgi:hypothetical protein